MHCAVIQGKQTGTSSQLSVTVRPLIAQAESLDFDSTSLLEVKMLTVTMA